NQNSGLRPLFLFTYGSAGLADRRFFFLSIFGFYILESFSGVLFFPETSPTGVRGHDRHIMMHGIGFQGGLPCRGARCRRWTSGVSLSGWRGRKERTGASCAGGSGFMLTPATSGFVVG